MFVCLNCLVSDSYGAVWSSELVTWQVDEIWMDVFEVDCR